MSVQIYPDRSVVVVIILCYDECVRFTPQRKIKILWSSNFAYAIGLLTSDGYLSADGRHLGIKSVDKEMVDNLKRALSIKNKVSLGVRGGEKIKKYFYVTFGDIVFYRFLNKIGLTAAKSKTIKSVAVPDSFFADFLRGVFDGDGTFYSFWDTRWPNSFVFQMAFASASIDFINWLKSQLKRLFYVKGFVKKGDGVYNLTYFKGDTRKLFDAMYYKDDILFLERKYIKIKKAFKRDQELEFIRQRNKNKRWGSSVVEHSPEERSVAGSIPAPSI